MNNDAINEDFVRQAATLTDLELTPAHVPGVVLYFKMIAGFAALINEFPVDVSMEAAPVFTPCSPQTPE